MVTPPQVLAEQIDAESEIFSKILNRFKVAEGRRVTKILHDEKELISYNKEEENILAEILDMTNHLTAAIGKYPPTKGMVDELNQAATLIIKSIKIVKLNFSQIRSGLKETKQLQQLTKRSSGLLFRFFKKKSLEDVYDECFRLGHADDRILNELFREIQVTNNTEEELNSYIVKFQNILRSLQKQAEYHTKKTNTEFEHIRSDLRRLEQKSIEFIKFLRMDIQILKREFSRIEKAKHDLVSFVRAVKEKQHPFDPQKKYGQGAKPRLNPQLEFR